MLDDFFDLLKKIGKFLGKLTVAGIVAEVVSQVFSFFVGDFARSVEEAINSMHKTLSKFFDWAKMRFGSGKEAAQDGPQGNTAVSRIDMPGREDTAQAGQDTAPDTQAMEEAFATLQEKITGLFDETLTDLIARVEEAVAARGCIKGA